MDLTPFKDMKISLLIRIGEILNKPIQEAIPCMQKICDEYNISWAERGKDLCRAAKALKDL